MPTTKRIFAVVLTLLAVGGGCMQSSGTDTGTSDNDRRMAPTAFTDWVPYTATDGSFSVDFPATPEYEPTQLPINGTELTFSSETYSSETDSAFMSVGKFIYPTELDLSDVDARLQGSLDSMLASTDGTAIASDYADYNGYRSLNYTIESGDGLRLQGFAFVQDHTVYQLMYVYDPASYDEAFYQHFANSFKLN